MKALSWINCILGIWLIIAGFTLSAGVGAVMAERIILGIIIVVLAATAASGQAQAGISWVVALAGLWTLVAPGFIHYGARGVSNASDVVVGIVVLVLGLVNAFYQTPARTRV